MSFGRVCKISAFGQPNVEGAFFEDDRAGIEITDLRVQFEITKSLGKHPNTCEVTISNLDDRSIVAFQKRPIRVHVEAGYETEGGPRLLFVGDVRAGSGTKTIDTDTETKLLLGDGSRAFAEGRINRSYTRGTPVRTLLRDAARSLGLELPHEVDVSPAVQTAIASGEVVSGYASDELSRLLAPFGYTFSIQNGRLQILRDNEVRPGIFVLSEGIIGSPDHGVPDKKGRPPRMTVLHELYPEILPGGTIEVISKDIKGRFKVIRVKHTGDTEGDEWESEIEATPL